MYLVIEMLTDTHCHIFSNSYENVHDILNYLETYNIKRIIINGYNYQTNLEVLDLIDKYDNVYGALGVHPSNMDKNFDKTFSLIEDNLNHPKIVAVGEIGLDYYWNKDNKKIQLENFNKLLKLAQKHNKPVIIHNRESTEDMLKTITKYKLKGIMHCFSGSYEVAKEYIKNGYKLGINGIVTFSNAKLPEILEKIDISNILLETDAPFITPEPHRKNKNEPKYLGDIAKKVAQIYKLDENDLALKLEENLLSIFDF